MTSSIYKINANIPMTFFIGPTQFMDNQLYFTEYSNVNAAKSSPVKLPTEFQTPHYPFKISQNFNQLSRYLLVDIKSSAVPKHGRVVAKIDTPEN